MDNCIFCKIIKKEVPANILWENDNFILFLDANPKGEGHSLLVPKKHFESLSEVSGIYKDKFVEAMQEAGDFLMDKYNAGGFNIVLNNGKVAGQVIPHIHFHFMPRKQGNKQRGLFLG